MDNIKIGNFLLRMSQCMDKKTADGIGLDILTRCLIVEPIQGCYDQNDIINEDIDLPYYKIIKVCNYTESEKDLQFGDIIMSSCETVIPVPVTIEGHDLYFLYESQIDMVYKMDRQEEDNMSFDVELIDFDVEYMEYVKGMLSKKEDWEKIAFEPYGDRMIFELLPPRTIKDGIEMIAPESLPVARIVRLPKPEKMPGYLADVKVGDFVFFNGTYFAIEHEIEDNKRICVGSINNICGIYRGITKYINESE